MINRINYNQLSAFSNQFISISIEKSTRLFPLGIKSDWILKCKWKNVFTTFWCNFSEKNAQIQTIKEKHTSIQLIVGTVTLFINFIHSFPFERFIHNVPVR